LLDRAKRHATDLTQGEVVGRDFEVVRLAGRGSFSTVYEAAQLSRQRRPVALKVLHQGIQHELERQANGVVENPYLIEQVLSERVLSPVICRVYRVGTHDGRFFAALEWVNGTTLDHLIQERRGRLSLDFVAGIVASLGAAIETMHQQEVVHRDLKPSNIMVEDDQGRPVVRLIDLGIAKNVGESELANMNATGSLLVGTPAYMAPEQADGRVTDPRSDIFSLAAVAYELLTGQRHIQPGGGARGADTYLDYLLSTSPIPTYPACHVRCDLPEEVDEILSSALSRDRHRRQATVARFCDDLEVVLRAAAPIPKRPSLLTRTIGRLRRSPVRAK
jgi:serine/threonine protein kinase